MCCVWSKKERNSLFIVFITTFDDRNVLVIYINEYQRFSGVYAQQRRLNSGLQSIMVNERLITRGFSLMR